MVLFDMNVFIELFVISFNVFMFVYGLGGRKLKIRKNDMC